MVYDGSVDKTLFTLKHGNDFLLVQIYVDDIIFNGSSRVLVSSFQKIMENEFHMSMMGGLTFFFGIQVKQTKHDTFIHQGKYTKDLMKKFNMVELNLVSTLMSTATALIRRKMAKLMIKGSTGAWLAPFCTSCWHIWTFSSLFAYVHAFKLAHTLHIGKPFNGSLGISNTHSNLGSGTLLLHHLILLAFPMLILWVVELIKKALLVHVIFLDLLLFIGLLINNLLLHNPP
jgi:hypothetical protein